MVLLAALIAVAAFVWGRRRRLQRHRTAETSRDVEQAVPEDGSGIGCLPVLLGKGDKTATAKTRPAHVDSETLGISVEYAVDVFPAKARAATGLANPNFHEICAAMAVGASGEGHAKTCPRDGKAGCSIVDAIDERYRGRATHFMSWSWNYRLADFESAIRRWIRSQDASPGDTFIWICFFCNNQYRMVEEASTTGSDDLKEIFESHLVQAGQMLVMLDSFLDPCYITRAWCIFECYVCIHRALPMTVILPESAEESFSGILDSGLGLGSVRRAFSQIDLKNATASYKADEDRIKDIIAGTIGFAAVNSVVKDCLMDWLTTEFQRYLRGT